jgi:hypothetical protein
MTVISIRLDEYKVYWIKRYKDGHYYMNQGIFGKQFYRQWTRTNKAYALSLLRGYHGQMLPYTIMTCSK